MFQLDTLLDEKICSHNQCTALIKVNVLITASLESTLLAFHNNKWFAVRSAIVNSAELARTTRHAARVRNDFLRGCDQCVADSLACILHLLQAAF